MRIAYVAEERTGVCSRRHRCSRNTKPYKSRQGAIKKVAAMQESDNHEVAADEAAEDCVFAGEPFRRLLQIAYRAYWVRVLQQPRSFHSDPVRRGAADRTTRPGMSSKDGELKGESAEPVPDGGIGPKTLPDAGVENNRTAIGKYAFDADLWASARSE